MNENAQWQMIKDSVLFALSSGFSVSLFHFYLKKNRLEVYCSVFLRILLLKQVKCSQNHKINQ
jgi:hypothetical protein